MLDIYADYGSIYDDEDSWDDSYEKQQLALKGETEVDPEICDFYEFLNSSDCEDDDTWCEELTADQAIQESEKLKQEADKRLKNERRDERGRLQKGSRIAAKQNCDKNRICLYYAMGCSVKEIVTQLGCSKTTVYRVLKESNITKIDEELPFN